MIRVLRLPTCAVALLLSIAACSGGSDVPPAPGVEGFEVLPYAGAKGESRIVQGVAHGGDEQVENFRFIVLDSEAEPVPVSAEITLAGNPFSGSTPTWDLRAAADMKIQTTAASPSGRYEVMVYVETKNKNRYASAPFIIR